MKKLLNLLGIGIVIGTVYLVWVSVPVARDMLACYDASITDFDTIEFRTRSQGWTELSRCKIKKERIITLDRCLSDAQAQQDLPTQVIGVIDQSIQFLRPSGGSLSTIKAVHDQECAGYPDTMFQPPD